MSLQDIEWTESEGDTDDNLELENFRDSSDDEHEFNRQIARPEAGRSRRSREEELDPEVEEAYQEARNLYTSGDYKSALVLLEEAIKHESQSKLLYNLLANIHEERKDMEKALLARIAVAHLDKRDKDTWIDIAERSVQLGYLAQAALFFQHVSRLDRSSWHLLRTRADLHIQLGEPVTALSLLQRIRNKFFGLNELTQEEKTEILLNIAGCLKDVGKLDEATQIYLDIFNKGINPDHDDPPEVILDWQNLNVLLELLLEQKQYQQVISMAKDGARYIKGRGDERCWQPYNLQNDAEFDDRRFDLVKKMTAAQAKQITNLHSHDQYDLPIDIRIWLLESRLKQIPSHLLLKSQNSSEIESLPAVLDAMIHVEELKKHKPVEEYSDLYQRAALAFFDARLYSQARELYIFLTGIAHESISKYLEMTVQVAKCEMELRNVERAEQLYKFVLEKDPENQESLVAMCEIYSSGNKVNEFQETLSKLEFVRSVVNGDDSVPIKREVPMAHAAGAGNVFVESESTRARQPGSRLSRAERAELERNAQERADHAFSGLNRYQTGLDQHNAVAVMEWLRYADELVEMFASHRKFFPVSRQKDFFSFEGSSRSSVDQRVQRLKLARDDQQIADDLEVEQQLTRDEMEDSYIWRGQPLSFWFIVFCQCALEHAKRGNSERAQQVISIAQAANVFSFNSAHRDTMDFVALSCAYLCQDSELVSSIWRHLQTRLQFNTTAYQLYIALFGQNKKSLQVFASSNNQKFFLRQIKALDSLVHVKGPIVGMAKVLNPDTAPTEDDPTLLMLYVYIMLQGPSYTPALMYLIRCREQLRDHPLVLLVYGIVQVLRSSQRTSLNRHTQVLEGLSFMESYCTQRINGASEEHKTAILIETKYNMGRFFHGIGLLTYAVKYYEDALELYDQIEDCDFNLAREAAYNLHLIYMQSGNMELSLEIINRYLTI